jgi:hypothetical protein
MFAVPLQGASTIANVLVTSIFCQIGVLRKLHYNKAAICKTQTTTLRQDSGGMMEQYMKVVEAI